MPGLPVGLPGSISQSVGAFLDIFMRGGGALQRRTGEIFVVAAVPSDQRIKGPPMLPGDVNQTQATEPISDDELLGLDDALEDYVEDSIESPHGGLARSASSPVKSPVSYGIAEGTVVRIRGEARVHVKLRKYALTQAQVVEVPVHPNTWYGVRLYDGRRVKIRKSAFDVLPAGNPNTPAKLALDDSSWYDQDLDAVAQLQREAARQQQQLDEEEDSAAAAAAAAAANDPVIDYATWVGERVVIKSGKYKGTIGTVKTWNKIDCKFRIYIGQGEEVTRKTKHVDLYTEVLRAARSKRSRTSASMDDSPVSNSSSRPSKSRKKAVKNYVGCYVRVTGGRHKGLEGFVQRGGNGYYSVEITSEDGDPNGSMIVMKRSAELELADARGQGRTGGVPGSMDEEEEEDDYDDEAFQKQQQYHLLQQQELKRRKYMESVPDRFVGCQVRITDGEYTAFRGVILRVEDGIFVVQVMHTNFVVNLTLKQVDFGSTDPWFQVAVLEAGFILCQILHHHELRAKLNYEEADDSLFSGTKGIYSHVLQKTLPPPDKEVMINVGGTPKI